MSNGHGHGVSFACKLPPFRKRARGEADNVISTSFLLQETSFDSESAG